MVSAHIRLLPALWEALRERRRATGQSISEIVGAALADHLQLDHATLFQFSSSTALVEGIYEGEATIASLRQHGDFGLGTFDGLDGEMVVLEGRFYQCRADGSVHEVEETTRSPFAVITAFAAERTVDLAAVADLAALESALDELRRSDNIFYAFRVDGHFRRVHTRAMAKTAEGVPLVEAAAHQPEFELHDVSGTLVGFWSPSYARTLTVPGYHLHFLTDDRRAGGHVLECSGDDLRVQIQHEAEMRVALPENREFLEADLSRDPGAALDRAEK
jgi:acetolactate decarboxylase